MAGQRDGSNKLVLLAKSLLALVVAWQGQILRNFPDNSAIKNLLEAILALAPLLAEAEQDLIEYGGQNDPIIEDPTQAGGYGGGVPSIDPYA